MTATPAQITTFNDPFTITWTTTGTTATHICRLGIRPAQAGDESIVPISIVACTGTMQHTPTGLGDFNYVLTIHQGTNQPAISKATSNTITRDIPNLGATTWTRQFGTNADDTAYGVAADAAGNIIITGHTYGSLEGVNAGSTDVFVRKYDARGNTLWTRQFGTNGDDNAYGVTTDAADNIIITGITSGSLVGTNASGLDAFVRKYDAVGNTLWTRQFGTNGDDNAYGVTTDPTGNIIITGHTYGSLEGTNAGSTDVLVRKYDPNGNTLWTRQFGTDKADYSYGVTTDPAGNIIITGHTYGSLEGTNAGYADAFVRKYDPNGLVVWTHQFGTNDTDDARSVTTDAAGNVIIIGYTDGSLEGTNAGIIDAFMRKYDPNGLVVWTRQFGTNYDDYTSGVTTDPAGNIIITGHTFGSLEGVNAGNADAFVRKYDTNGNTLWTRQFGTNADDDARSVTTDAASNIIITGYTEGAIEGTNAGIFDAFVRKLTP